MSVIATKAFQGASRHTERKEIEIGGLVQMRLRQLKGMVPARHYDKIMIADVFSGSGENVVEKGGDPIDGSPLRILWALQSAIQTQNGPNPMGLAGKEVHLLFSDIRQTAIDHLSQVLADKHQKIVGPHIYTTTMAMDAGNAMGLIGEFMARNRRAHLILVLDPNGPKDFPRDEVLNLLSAHSNRVDLIPYISATAVNRCLRHRDLCGATYNWWLSAIDRFDTGFVHAIARNRRGWIRKPIANDPQRWLMLPTFTTRLLPRNAWARQGYVEINSDAGNAAIAVYSGIREAS